MPPVLIFPLSINYAVQFMQELKNYEEYTNKDLKEYKQSIQEFYKI